MGKSLNKVQLIGHLGKDPDLRYGANSNPVVTFSVATNERWKNGDEWKDHTEWHRCVGYGKIAEQLGEYLTKGRQVYLEGRLHTRSWEDKQGQKRYTTEIVIRDYLLLGARQQAESPLPETPMSGEDAEAEGAFTSEEDIPF